MGHVSWYKLVYLTLYKVGGRLVSICTVKYVHPVRIIKKDEGSLRNMEESQSVHHPWDLIGYQTFIRLQSVHSVLAVKSDCMLPCNFLIYHSKYRL